MGYDDAATQKVFSQVLDPSQSDKQLMIYQNRGVGVVKTYNDQEDSFTKGYMIVDLMGKKLSPLEL